MQPRIHVLTLAVDDLERALTFYRDGLGWATDEIVGTEFAGDARTPAGAVVVFRLHPGVLMCLYPRSELAKDARVDPARPSPGEFSVGHAVATRDDVDAVLARARSAGALITEAPHDRPWGIYSGYFRDPDGHLWEVLWNAGIEDLLPNAFSGP